MPTVPLSLPSASNRISNFGTTTFLHGFHRLRTIMVNVEEPKTIAEYDTRDNNAWMFSFAAAMVPFTGFCYGHSKGLTGKVLEKMVKAPGGFYCIFALPFVTLAMEKCIYDTAQSVQGLNPNMRPADRGGFPSGGADLPSFSLVPVRKKNIFENISWFSK